VRNFSLESFGVKIPSKEIVVLTDSGYDCKELQNAILSRGWDFISALKCRRQFSSTPKEWDRVDKYFEDGRRSWKSVRIESCRGKKIKLRQYNYKQRVGFLKGVRRQVKLVCSKRSHESKCKMLASSNLNVSPKLIILCYRKRWEIEVFHREIKSYLGMEDAGVRSFLSLQNHIHWVYLSYLLLMVWYPTSGIKNSQNLFEREIRRKELKKSLQILSRIKGKDELKVHYRSALRRMEHIVAA